MNTERTLQYLKVVGLVSLLACSVLFFNWDDVTPHIIAGTVCLVLFLSSALQLLSDNINDTSQSGCVQPPPQLPDPPKIGSSVTTSRTSPLLPPPGSTQQPASPVSINVCTDDNWSLIMSMDTMDKKVGQSV